jgi:signal transduction histidine kinase
VSMRIAPPIPHEVPDSASLTTFKIPEPVALLSPEVSVRSDRIPPACEHCTRLRFRFRERRKQKRREFDKIIQDKAELLGLAVHDLRLPVATIQIYSELLAEGIGGGVSPELLEWINSIHSVSEFALRVLDETLDLAIAESGAVQLHTAPAILSDVVENSVSMNFPLAARKQIGLTLIQDGEPQPVLMDRVKMSKVFNNLIENAIKYCQPGARIQVQISHGRDSARVSVQDDGPGIGHADLKTLFTPFQRTRARALSGEPGAGLGLSIAKRTVDLHGGRIWLKSEVGKGTTFYVCLPIQIRSPAKRS